MKLLLASRNEGKVLEFQNILSFFSIEVVGLNDLDDDSEVAEDGNSFEENAYLKASYYYKKYQLPCIADDSGLVVEALGGRPGIHSARFSGPEANSYKNNLKLLELMKDKKNRQAYFICVICFIASDGQVSYFSGKLCGEIASSLEGNNGFGYDPLFIVTDYNQTLGQMDLILKNKISHRYQAIDKLVNFLKKG